MATYAELLQAAEDPNLNNRCRVAVVVAAELVRTEPVTTPNHAARLKWARQAMTRPDEEARRLLWAVLAQNRGAPFAAIRDATDEQVQNAVNAAIDVFAVET